MSIYDPLTDWLRAQNGNRIPATFGQIEAILHFDLPDTARRRSQWWENNSDHHSHARAWLTAGLHTEEVNLTAETLTFIRVGL
jgi:hypothetical protein